MKEKALIVGTGGREKTLGFALKQNKPDRNISYCPADETHERIIERTRRDSIDLVVVGPEQPLVNGLVDDFYAAGLPEEGHFIFGPTAGAAMIEGSKAWANEFMGRHEIPTAESETFTNDRLAYNYMMSRVGDTGLPIVVKADGLASGKGCFVCQTASEATDRIEDLLVRKTLGDAGNRIVIEDYLEGEEATIMAITDGRTILPLIPSQDHKLAFETEHDRKRWLAAGGIDPDTCPNTGGMGAYAPAPVVTDEIMQRVYDEILVPTIRGMEAEGVPFRGCLYAGVMITADGPKVVEFNARFGDPEAQVVLPMLENDPYVLIKEAAKGPEQGNLAEHKIRNKDGAALCVVMASGGYPREYEPGKLITGLDAVRDMQHVRAIHAGTRFEGEHGERVLTDGGRVLDVVGMGKDILQAFGRTYVAVSNISWESKYYRTDVGPRALEPHID